MRKLAIVAALAFAGTALLFGSFGAYAQTASACNVEAAPAGCDRLWALQLEVVVPPASEGRTTEPGCALEAREDVMRVVRAGDAVKWPKVVDYSGPIEGALEGPIDDHLRGRGVDARRLFQPYALHGATCANVAAVIPVRSFFMGYRLLASDDLRGAEFRPCEAGRECPIGRSQFPDEPVQQRSGSINIVSATFINSSPDQPRKARLVIFYKMLGGQQPRTSIDK